LSFLANPRYHKQMQATRANRIEQMTSLCITDRIDQADAVS